LFNDAYYPAMAMTGQSQSSTDAYVWKTGDRLNNGAICLIRTARQPDLSLLADLLTQAFHPQEGLVAWLNPVFRLGIYEDLRHRFYAREPHTVCLVAIDTAAIDGRRSLEGPIAGTVEMALRYPKPWQPQRPPFLYISNLAVRPCYRRQGVARQLLGVCEQIAKDWGYADLYLHVLANNDPARRLYHHLGFQVRRADVGVGSLLLKRPQQLLLSKALAT
jgi:ribosomal protein S18 acetylase RimI-like enzyme